MEKKDIKDILYKVESGEFNEQEEQIVKRWLFYLNTKNKAKLSEFKLNTVSRRIWERLEGPDSRKPMKVNRMTWAAGIAAVIALIIFFGGYFFYIEKIELLDKSNLMADDLAPGRVGATLTIANGKKIRLSDAANGEIAKEAGISISKTPDGQIVYEIKSKESSPNQTNVLTTARGETYVLILPDRSKVWLNAASSLTYTAALMDHGVRRVKLQGEAYFEISLDKIHPFIVESRNQQVEVLGTHFNISAYSDEAMINTTLLEGRVRVSGNGHVAVLVPGRQAINENGKIWVNEVNTGLVTAWKNNKFIFDSLSIQEIMRMISRWYDVEIIYQGAVPEDRFWGSVSRFENVSEVLRLLEKTGNVHFKIEGRKIYVSK